MLKAELKTKKDQLKDVETAKATAVKDLQGQLRDTQREVANLKKAEEKAKQQAEDKKRAEAKAQKEAQKQGHS